MTYWKLEVTRNGNSFIFAVCIFDKLDTAGALDFSNSNLDYKTPRNLGFKKTDHLIFCPLCKQLVYAVRIGSMGWIYERCPNCLIAFNSKD